MNNEIKFKRDIAFRKQFFVPDSFSHPAKLDAQLCIWITERYTKPGETILDPMAGSGTQMLACTLGRNVILLELEEKFCKMARDNWEQVRMKPQLGYSMGECQILQGDARNLEGLFADSIVTSPPYANQGQGQGKEYHPERMVGTETGLGRGYGDNPSNIGNLPYGNIDSIVTSPPYAEAQSGGGISAAMRGEGNYKVTTKMPGSCYQPAEHSTNPSNIGNLPYGNIDSIVTSPPYETQASHSVEQKISSGFQSPKAIAKIKGCAREYSDNQTNIGNLKGSSYLEAMLQVYDQCFKVLKPGGLMILILKNFIRDKKVIRLDLDTIKLCEQVGFQFVERHYRKLPAQSFWRTLYKQKFPDVEEITHEDVIVFRKGVG